MPIFVTLLAALMLLVIYFDAKQFIIPNWLNGLLIALYVPFVLLSPVGVDWQNALLGMAIVFVAGYAIFMLKFMGGGDIKLFIALALWVGLKGLISFLIIVVMLGGVLSIVLLIARAVLGNSKAAASGTLPRAFRHKEPVPYGLAIAGGFLFLLFTGKIPGILG